MIDASPVSTKVKTVIAEYEGEHTKIKYEEQRLLRLRAQIESAAVFEIGCLKREPRNADPVEPVQRWGERLIRLSVDGGASTWSGDYHPGLGRASEIAAVPLHALLLSWVTEQERALHARRAVWEKRDLSAEIAAVLEPA